MTHCNKTSLLVLIWLSLLLGAATANLSGQETAPPGVQYIMVNFNTAPANVNVSKSVLRYNKDFAVSFHADDGFQDVYTVGFQFFTGINEGGNNFPGLFFTDGCGNDISFKLSSSIFSYSGYNNEDMHQPGNGYGTVTWPQMATMYLNGCSINNHGFTSDAFTEPDYMHYTIRRNESFIRRRLLNTIVGGVKTRIFVNPNGATPYTDVAFAAGYRSVLRMGAWGVIPNEGLDIGTFTNWDQNLELNRVLAESVNLQQMVDQYADAAVNGSHYWMPVFTHRIVEDYPQASFFSDFNYIANTYGKNGTDKVWMATEEEIIDYQIVRQLTSINYGLTGNTLLITLNGEIPTSLRYHALSLVVEADASINSINIIGGTGNSYSGIGTNSSLINLKWDGTVAENLFELAETNVTYAEQNPTEYNGLIAMDYVLMLPAGPEKEAFKTRLCALSGIDYEPGFCASCEVDLGMGLSVCSGDCVTIQAPDLAGNTYLWSTGETTSSIVYCPESSGELTLTVTDANNCIATDTVNVELLPTMFFDLGEDLGVCPDVPVVIPGPDDPSYLYQWFQDGTPLQENSSVLNLIATDTTLIWLDITLPNGCVASDSLIINVWEKPIVSIEPGAAGLCLGESITLTGSAINAVSFEWYNGSNATSITFEPLEAGVFKPWFRAVNGFGCAATDTSTIEVYVLPDFTFSAIGSTTVCAGDSITLEVEISPVAEVTTLVWNGTITVPTNGQTLITKTFAVNTGTTFSVKAISSNGCEKLKEIAIAATPPPVMTISNDTESCAGFPVELTANGGLSCQWYEGSNLIGNTYTIQVEPLITTYYRAVVTASAPLFCTSEDSVLVTVNPQPEIQIQASQTEVCQGTTVILTASGAHSYQWSTGETGQQVFVVPDESYSYGVTGTSLEGCVGQAEISIDVLAVPEVSMDGLMTVYCENDHPSLITAIPEGGFFSGTPLDDGYFNPGSAGEGLHTIYYQVTAANGCVGIDSLQTHVIAFNQSIELGDDVALCPHESVVLDAGEGFETYYWSTGHSSRQIEISGSSYLPGTSRTISVVALSGGCAAADAIELSVRSDCYIGLNDQTLHPIVSIVPNPSKGWIELKTPYDLEAVSLKLMDAEGKILWSSSGQLTLKATEGYRVSFQQFTAGLYFLHITNQDLKLVTKLVIQ